MLVSLPCRADSGGRGVDRLGHGAGALEGDRAGAGNGVGDTTVSEGRGTRADSGVEGHNFSHVCDIARWRRSTGSGSTRDEGKGRSEDLETHLDIRLEVVVGETKVYTRM